MGSHERTSAPTSSVMALFSFPPVASSFSSKNLTVLSILLLSYIVPFCLVFSFLLPVYFHHFSYFRVGSTPNFRMHFDVLYWIHSTTFYTMFVFPAHPRSSLSWRKHGRFFFNTTWMEDAGRKGFLWHPSLTDVCKNWNKADVRIRRRNIIQFEDCILWIHLMSGLYSRWFRLAGLVGLDPIRRSVYFRTVCRPGGF